jgi:hypothetical protein
MNVRSEIDKPLLDPQSHPIWIVTGFIVALLALVMSFVGIHNTGLAVVATQMQVAQINQKLEEIDKRVPVSPQSADVQPQR